MDILVILGDLLLMDVCALHCASVFPGDHQGRLVRHKSSESMSSINSISSACSATSQQSSATDIDCKRKDKKKNKSWVSILIHGWCNKLLMK